MRAEKGTLYVVATPIGNLGDLSPRAVQLLSDVDLIAAEDTRHSRSLLAHFGIRTSTVSVHEHNEGTVIGGLLDRIQQGAAVALISDAGTPLISDPGFLLVREARVRGIRVSPLPGANAAVCALSASGLPTDRFVFEGFLPRAPGLRRARLQVLKGEIRTLVCYESGRRVLQTLRDMRDILGGERRAVYARELTKLHETLLSASLEVLCDRVTSDPLQSKGEIVLLVHGAKSSDRQPAEETERVLRILTGELPLKKAVALAAKITGVKKNQLYRQALAWRARQ